jgi:plastocyanin
MRIVRALLAAVVVGLVVGAPVPVAATELVVTISSGLDPRDAVVAPGTTVTWVNSDGERHRVRSASFDSGNLEPGDRFSFTFTAEGRTTYVDDRDRSNAAYHGSVTVTGGGGGGGGGATTAPPADPAPAGTAAVSIGDGFFSPASVVIAPGGTVTWTNGDDRAHTATAGDGSFDTGSLGAGTSSTKAFPNEGTFSYVCELHPDMTGVVRVSAAPAAAPPPPAPAPAPAPAAAPAPPPAAPAPTAAAGPSTRNISMADFAFSPATVDARVGDTLVWTNTGRAPHTATGNAFDSGRVAAGGTFRFTTTATGTLAYTCTFHPEMTGTIRVAAASAPAPTVVAPPPPPPPASTTSTTTTATTTTSTSDAAAPSTVDVEARDNEFSPRRTTVAPGGTVTWTLTGRAPHSITGDGFDAGILDPGATFAHTFADAGTYDYACLVHPDMTGTIEVQLVAATSGPPPTPASTTSADDTQAWTIALLGGGGILAATGLLLTGARRFLLAS